MFGSSVYSAIYVELCVFFFICPVFIDENLNAQKFLDLLNGPVTDYLEGLSVAAYSHVWFQLDGAPLHSVVSVRDRLTTMFGEQWFGRYGPHRYQARSPDLTVLDFFYGDSLKSMFTREFLIMKINYVKVLSLFLIS